MINKQIKVNSFKHSNGAQTQKLTTEFKCKKNAIKKH